MSRLRVVFPKPGFFLTDTTVQVDVDGRNVFQGSFKAGFELVVPVEPGAHRIDTRILLPPFSRKREFSVDVAATEVLTVELSYSRFWGNFDKSPKTARAPLVP